MSTVQEILTAMDKLTPDELRVVKLGVDSRLADDDDDPALHPRCRKRSLMPTLIPKKANQSMRFARSFQNGFPSRNHRPGHRRSCRDRILYRERQPGCSIGAWQSFARRGIESGANTVQRQSIPAHWQRSQANGQAV